MKTTGQQIKTMAICLCTMAALLTAATVPTFAAEPAAEKPSGSEAESLPGGQGDYLSHADRNKNYQR